MSYYMVKVQEVQVLGMIWMPQCLAAMVYKVSDYDLENMRGPEKIAPTRAEVQKWLDSHAGDFSVVLDFRADLGDWEVPWENEENEYTWHDLMFGEEE